MTRLAVLVAVIAAMLASAPCLGAPIAPVEGEIMVQDGGGVVITLERRLHEALADLYEEAGAKVADIVKGEGYSMKLAGEMESESEDIMTSGAKPLLKDLIMAEVAIALVQAGGGASMSTVKELYQQVMSTKGDDPDAAWAAYYLALVLDDEGSTKTAIKLYDELVKTFPTHGLVTEAIFRAGETYRAGDDCKSAIVYYDKLTQEGVPSPWYEYGLSRAALCSSAIGDFGKTVQTATTLMDRLTTAPKVAADLVAPMLSQALTLTGLALATPEWKKGGPHATDKGVARAAALLTQKAPWAAQVMAFYGQLVHGGSTLDEVAESAEAYLAAIDMQPQSDQALFWLEQANAAAVESTDGAVQGKVFQVAKALVGPGGTFVTAHAGTEAADKAKALYTTIAGAVPESLLAQAMELKKGGDTAKAGALFSEAIKAYDTFIAGAPATAPARYEAMVHRAEAYLYSGKPTKALEDFEAARDELAGGSMKELMEHAAFGAVMAAQELVLQGITKKTIPGVFHPKNPVPAKGSVAMPVAVASWVAAIDAYVTGVETPRPGEPEFASKASYMAGQAVEKAGDLAKARGIYAHIIDTWPGSKAASYAKTQIVATCTKLGDMECAEKYVAGTSGSGAASSSPSAQALNVKYKKGMKLMKSGKPVAAGDAFVAITELSGVAPKDAESAYLNAIHCYEKGKAYDKVASTIDGLLTASDGKGKGDAAPDKLQLRKAFALFAAKKPKEAAQACLALYEVAPKHKQIPECLLQSAGQLVEQGDKVGAAELWAAFAKVSPKHPKAAKALVSAILATEASGDPTAAISMADQFLSTYGKKGQKDMLLVAHVIAARNPDLDDKAKKKHLAAAAKLAQKIKGPSATNAHCYAAEVVFHQTDDDLAALQLTTVGGTTKTFTKSVDKLQDKAIALEAKLEKVLKLGCTTWAFAAMVRMAEAYLAVAKALSSPSIPDGIDGASLEADLAKIAASWETKAGNALQMVIDKSGELGVEDQWTKKANELKAGL